jgi:hypothetical protein
MPMQDQTKRYARFLLTWHVFCNHYTPFQPVVCCAFLAATLYQPSGCVDSRARGDNHVWVLLLEPWWFGALGAAQRRASWQPASASSSRRSETYQINVVRPLLRSRGWFIQPVAGAAFAFVVLAGVPPRFFACLSALRAAHGGVEKPFLLVEFLLSGSKDKWLTTITTDEFDILVAHHGKAFLTIGCSSMRRSACIAADAGSWER